MRRLLHHILFAFLAILNLHSAAIANEIEKKFIAAGLVDIATIDATIQVDLVNSDPRKNFFRENFYYGLNKAYLQKDVARKLSRAQKILKSKHPSYSLKIYDAARPRAVSQAMYDKMKGTRFERYVAHPATGSMHNYGVAVDITIVDGNKEELDMGISPFNKTRVQLYWQYAKKKLGRKLTPKQRKNRKLLAKIMQDAGFFPLSFEWWHFNGMKKDTARKTLKIIE